MAHCANCKTNIVAREGDFCIDCDYPESDVTVTYPSKTDGLRFTRDQRQKLENEHRRREQEEE